MELTETEAVLGQQGFDLKGALGWSISPSAPPPSPRLAPVPAGGLRRPDGRQGGGDEEGKQARFWPDPGSRRRVDSLNGRGCHE